METARRPPGGLGVSEERPGDVVVNERARDVVLGAQGGAPKRQELGEACTRVEHPGARELDAGGGGDERRLRRCVVAVVAVPEVEGQLRKR